jgi:hypothetical protein
MKTPKISLDSKKIQALLLAHVEKIVLVVVVALVGWFIYQGFILEGLPEGRSPDLLLVKGNETMQFIDDPNHWTALAKEEPRQVSMNVTEKVSLSQLATDSSKYPPLHRWSPPDFPKLSPRTDPKIFAPIHLVVRPISGPLAAYTDGAEVDPLSQAKVDAAASPPTKTTPRPRPRTTTRPRGPKGEGVDGGGRGEGPDLLAGQPLQPEGGFGPTGGAGPKAGAIHPESIRGYESTDASAIARDTRAMVVMAVVPYEKQIEEFANSLESSLDYDANRDFPLYLQFAAERADVTANPAANPADDAWTKINVPAVLLETQKWAGYLPEIVDPDYIHEKLTHPAPPFMQRDIWDLVTHPDVPLMSYATSSTDPLDTPAPPMPTGDSPGIDVPLPMPGGVPGGGESGQGPIMRPRPGMAGGEHGGPMVRQPRAPRMAGMQDEGGGSALGSSTAPPPTPKYQLVRFTDTTVEPGKVYRYRIRVYLHDPNHPAQGYTSPTIVSLDGKVQERVKALDAADAARGGGFRTYWVMSDWSEPSPAATLPPVEHFFAGKVTQPAATQVVEGRPKVPTNQPQAKALTVVWDRSKVVDVPAEHDVFRGSGLDFVQDAQVIHPVTHEVIDLAKYPFSTRALVVDMQGGERIPPVERKNEHPLDSPGELLIFDAAGRLHVQDESRDIEGYRRYLVPKPEVKKPMPAGGAGEGFDGLLEQPPLPPRGKPPRAG